ncbi:hypothetical protein [Streptomyces sp. NRRL S-1448]|uniref:hypothetical protein n=1 Tax=Streptomyces sp. NRRL S-1448 TaxID=1463883 RepID=UPI000AC46711|nr:hypothetical protein [Streptomyces sp. NRRL S-1448]
MAGVTDRHPVAPTRRQTLVTTDRAVTDRALLAPTDHRIRPPTGGPPHDRRANDR